MTDSDKPKRRKERRGQGSGFCYQRQTDGKWISGIDLGRDAEGKRQRMVYASKTETAALEKLNKALGELGRGALLSTDRQTVGQYLDHWLEEVSGPTLRPRTYDDYSMVIAKHLKPAIGQHRLERLSPQHVQSMLNAKTRAGLAPRTVSKIRAVLRAALNDALHWDLVAKNVATRVDIPRIPVYEGKPLNPDEARRFIVAARGNRLETLFLVAIALGMREGEVFGLRWQDVNLDVGELRIEQQYQAVGKQRGFSEPKTERSRRPLPVPAPLITSLRAHRQRQLEERILAGSRWKDHNLVFCTTIGTPLDPANLTKHYRVILEKAELEQRTFHDLRRSCSSLLAAWKVPPHVVRDILGHSNITTTLKYYTRSYSDDLREATDLMNALFDDEIEPEKGSGLTTG